MDAENSEMQGQEQLEDHIPEANAESPKEQEYEKGTDESSHDPVYVQKRLKQQARAHARQMQELRSEMQGMREQVSAHANPGSGGQPTNPYMSHGELPEGIDPSIHKAVTYALGHRDMEERRSKEHASQQHVAKQYQGLHDHLDAMADKHDDFDEVVRGNAPFTPHMRDAALMLPKKGSGSAGEVLYKLGKNPEELKRIGQLHPLDQAAEMVRLSHALIGGDEKPRHDGHHNALGTVKSNPVTNSASITDKTSPGDIRRRMKAGTFK